MMGLQLLCLPSGVPLQLQQEYSSALFVAKPCTLREDCGYGVAVVMMGGVRAVDYDYGQDGQGHVCVG